MRASIVYLLFSMFSRAFLRIACSLFYRTFKTTNFVDINEEFESNFLINDATDSFDINLICNLEQLYEPQSLLMITFLTLLLAFLIKSPSFPFHM